MFEQFCRLGQIYRREKCCVPQTKRSSQGLGKKETKIALSEVSVISWTETVSGVAVPSHAWAEREESVAAADKAEGAGRATASLPLAPPAPRRGNSIQPASSSPYPSLITSVKGHRRVYRSKLSSWPEGNCQVIFLLTRSGDCWKNLPFGGTANNGCNKKLQNETTRVCGFPGRDSCRDDAFSLNYGCTNETSILFRTKTTLWRRLHGCGKLPPK